MGWIKVTRNAGPSWINTDQIVRVSSTANGGARLILTETDEKGQSVTMVVRETLDFVMGMIQGTGEDLVQGPP